jgi:hypothetical protein
MVKENVVWLSQNPERFLQPQKTQKLTKGHLSAASFSKGSKVSGLLKALYLAITLEFQVVFLIGSSRGQKGERMHISGVENSQ